MLQSGYAHATVSKLLTILSLGSFFMSDVQETYGLSVAQLGQSSTIWRVLTSQLFFSEGDGAVFAACLFYVCRQIERQMGSSKFLGFCTFVSVVAGLVQLELLYLFPSSFAAAGFSSGPYALAFALIILYWRWVPHQRRKPTVILGFNISEKFMTYLFCAQCFFAAGMASFVPSLTAIVPVATYLSGVRMML